LPIPFQDIAGEEPAAAVAYLRFLEDPNGGRIQGALFVTNGRGDPLEFCFTRVESGSGTLWRPGQAYRRAIAHLVKALFEAANHLPDLVLALAEESPPEIFTEEMEVQIPVCLVGDPSSKAATLHWIGREPSSGSALYTLVESLQSRELLREPFRRAAQGLEEAFTS
jgi:hypothetical protein